MNQFDTEIDKIEKALRELPRRIGILAADLFDKNFETSSFFGEKWKVSEYVKRTKSGGITKKTGSLIRSGRLRRSIKWYVNGMSVVFESNAPYAEIHNEGGTVNHPGGTAYYYNKKKGETIWVSNKKASGKNYPRTVAHKIEIPQRQFIGEHPVLLDEVEKEVNKVLSELGLI